MDLPPGSQRLQSALLLLAPPGRHTCPALLLLATELRSPCGLFLAFTGALQPLLLDPLRFAPARAFLLHLPLLLPATTLLLPATSLFFVVSAGSLFALSPRLLLAPSRLVVAPASLLRGHSVGRSLGALCLLGSPSLLCALASLLTLTLTLRSGRGLRLRLGAQPALASRLPDSRFRHLNVRGGQRRVFGLGRTPQRLPAKLLQVIEFVPRHDVDLLNGESRLRANHASA